MSESEEMYLVTIARLNEKGEDKPVPVAQLAAELDVLPVSANQMVRKLEDAGWMCYAPYKGVSLTPEGRSLALQILRNRRLWEVFLVENLKIPVDEASELACRMEHVLPNHLADRLAAYLGNPAVSPTGGVIPSCETDNTSDLDMPVVALELEHSGRVTRVTADSSGRAFLASAGVVPGAIIRVLGVSAGGSMLVQTPDGCQTQLSSLLARSLWVQPEFERQE